MNEKVEISTDQPLKSPENDRLGFAPFAKKIADIIKAMQVNDSIVFAVQGKWGSGKSTFLNFINFYLNDSDSTIIVKFNPWWFGNKEDLLMKFFLIMQSTLGKTDKFEKVVKHLIDFSKILMPILNSVSPMIGTIGNALFESANKILPDKTLEGLKSEISEALKEINYKIVVLIDDIDRLSGEEIRELFAIIKAIADFPNTIYILAFDKEIVARSLEKVQEGKGEEYLEKIIQVPIELPLINKISIRNMLIEELNTILIGTPEELFDKTYWGNVFWDGIDFFINNVRDIKRLTNAIRITYPSVKGEVNPIDFIAIETIRIFCPEVYYVIKNNPDKFCGHTFDFYDTSLASRDELELLKQFHQNWISNLNYSEEKTKNVINLLKRLFPKFESALGNTRYSSDWESEWRKKCRICSKEIFPRFFLFSIPSDDLSRHEIENILNSANNMEIFVNYLKKLTTQIRSDGTTKLSVFLDRMEDYIPEISQDNISVIIEVFFKIGDELIIPEDENKGLLNFGNDLRITRIIWQLLQRYNDKNSKFNVLKTAFENGQAISIMVKMIILLYELYQKTSNSEEKRILDKEHLDVLQEITLEKIKNAAADNSLLYTPLFPLVLNNWKENGNTDELNNWINQIVNSDEKLPTFLANFLQKKHSWTFSDRVTKINWTLNLNWLKSFIDLDLVEEKCKKLLSNKTLFDKLNERQKLAIELFLQETKKSNNGTDLN